MKNMTFAIHSPEGLHARPAQMFCSLAAKYQSKISVRNVTSNSKAVNAKSILLVLTLGVGHGHSVEITADGPDEEEALLNLSRLIEQNFPA